jgi:GNAT superfamily N-acetyltransferase
VSDPCVISPARDRDLGLILHAWPESFYDAHASGPLPRDVYHDAYDETVARVLAKPGVTCLVARSPRDGDMLYGFVVFEPGVLWMTYVKQPYRRRGFARALMTAAGFGPFTRFDYTFKSQAAGEMCRRWKGARWNPLIARRLKPVPRPDEP